MNGGNITRSPFVTFKDTGGAKNGSDDTASDQEWRALAARYLGSDALADKMVARISEMTPDRQRDVKKALLDHWKALHEGH